MSSGILIMPALQIHDTDFFSKIDYTHQNNNYMWTYFFQPN